MVNLLVDKNIKPLKKQRHSTANQYDAGLEIHLHASSPVAE